MTEVPNPAHAAKSVGKGIKGKITGHKPVVYVIMGVGVLAIAYYMRKRSQTNPLPTADASSAATDPTLDSSYYPDPTQGAGSSDGYVDPGAYGGYPTPDLSTFFDNLSSLLDTATQNASQAAADKAAASATATVPASSPVVNDTGGGAPSVPATIHYTPPAPAPAPPVFTPPPPTQGGWVQTSPVTVGSGLQQQVLSGGVSASPSPSPPPPSSPYGSKYPYHSDRGWYRLVIHPAGDRWHYYGPNDSPKIRVA